MSEYGGKKRSICQFDAIISTQRTHSIVNQRINAFSHVQHPIRWNIQCFFWQKKSWGWFNLEFMWFSVYFKQTIILCQNIGVTHWNNVENHTKPISKRHLTGKFRISANLMPFFSYMPITCIVTFHLNLVNHVNHFVWYIDFMTSNAMCSCNLHSIYLFENQ